MYHVLHMILSKALGLPSSPKMMKPLSTLMAQSVAYHVEQKKISRRPKI